MGERRARLKKVSQKVVVSEGGEPRAFFTLRIRAENSLNVPFQQGVIRCECRSHVPLQNKLSGLGNGKAMGIDE